MIKNQFYSTLRRQQRKINKLLISETLQKIIGAKISEISTDELYKFIKDEKVDYDDIKGIHKEALPQVARSDVEVFKAQAISEVKAERDSEANSSRLNRRSYRLSKKQTDDGENDYDVTHVAFLVLFKILRAFREANKDNLPNLSSQVSDASPASANNPKFSKKASSPKNKRNKKEEQKIINDIEVKSDSIVPNKFKEKYSKENTNNLIPKKYKSLFTTMKDSEEDYTPPKGIRPEDYMSSSEKLVTERRLDAEIEIVKDFILKEDDDIKGASNSKESEDNINKPKYFPEDSDPKAYYTQFLQVHTSPNKKLSFKEEREHSMNSNLSQSFAYNHEEYIPFSNPKNNMNLSKPTDLNFDSLSMNMIPSHSNFAFNMLNKTHESSRFANRQISLVLANNNFDSKKVILLYSYFRLKLLVI